MKGRERTKGDRMTKEELAEMEAAARGHVESVSYPVSLRWVFYRLLQEGIYSKKGDYERWSQQASKFRHDGTWAPDFLEDTTRKPVYRGIGEAWSAKQIIRTFLAVESLALKFHESHFTRQTEYTEVWFEARAMLGQFEKYTDEVVLRPFGGMTSIPMKARAAEDLGKLAERFGKPPVVLYFGDCDDHGRNIFTFSTTGRKGFAKWCPEKVKVVWCGLTKEQAERYEVPENPDKPGQYQWEALTDSAAEEIIRHAVQEHVDPEIVSAMWTEARRKAKTFSAKMAKRIGGGAA